MRGSREFSSRPQMRHWAARAPISTAVQLHAVLRRLRRQSYFSALARLEYCIRVGWVEACSPFLIEW